MGEFKGTPGPWFVSGEGIQAIVRAHDDFRIVATRHRLPKAEHEANARLIAAAPDLLDIAIRARDQFEFYAKSHEAKGAEDGNQKAEINRYMAAQCAATIARATGSEAK
ncbi:hypothetical protein [Caulobacter segnis]